MYVFHSSLLLPYLQAQKLRHLLEPYGRVGRIYLTPEDQTKHSNRVKTGGCKKACFTEGWVEFLSKADAKRIALMLNSKPLGGKKRHNFYHDDLWCMRYLSRFTWNDLIEHRVYQKQMNQKTLQVTLSKQKRDDEFFLESVAKKREMDSADLRREIDGKVETKKRRTDRPLPKQKFAFTHKKGDEGSSSLLDALAL